MESQLQPGLNDKPLSVALPACEGHQMAIVLADPSANQEVTVYGFNVMQVPNKPFQPRFKESIMKSLITVITVTAALLAASAVPAVEEHHPAQKPAARP